MLKGDGVNAASATGKGYKITSFDQQMHFELPDDHLASPPPFSGTQDFSLPPTLRGADPSRDPRAAALRPPGKVEWADFDLGTNIDFFHHPYHSAESMAGDLVA